jgi:hypothetical protein
VSSSSKYPKIELKMDVSITIYMHDKGAEMGTIYNYWYQPITPMKIMKEDGTADITVRKKIFIKDKDCNDAKEYDYFSKTNYVLLADCYAKLRVFHRKKKLKKSWEKNPSNSHMSEIIKKGCHMSAIFSHKSKSAIVVKFPYVRHIFPYFCHIFPCVHHIFPYVCHIFPYVRHIFSLGYIDCQDICNLFPRFHGKKVGKSEIPMKFPYVQHIFPYVRHIFSLR